MLKEYFFRAVQHVLGSFIFDAPMLSVIKIKIIGLFIEVGDNSYIAHRSILVKSHNPPNAKLVIGKNVGIEHECYIDYSGGVTIGNDVWISEGAFITSHNHKIVTQELKKKQEIIFSDLIIGDDAWLGARCMILPNVKSIGKGAVIGAGAIVTKNVDDWAIVVGNPAKTIGYRK